MSLSQENVLFVIMCGHTLDELTMNYNVRLNKLWMTAY